MSTTLAPALWWEKQVNLMEELAVEDHRPFPVWSYVSGAVFQNSLAIVTRRGRGSTQGAFLDTLSLIHTNPNEGANSGVEEVPGADWHDLIGRMWAGWQWGEEDLYKPGDSWLE